VPRNRDCVFSLFVHLSAVDTISDDEVLSSVRAALAEDVGPGDVTTLAVVPDNASVRAEMVAREALVVAGLGFAEAAFKELSPSVELVPRVRDGSHLDRGAVLLGVSGSARAILTAERVALNFVQRLSGVATLTRQYVEAVSGTGAVILDTRKTTPGWRRFEKYAVSCGGGRNHRLGLYDMVLIKDNHLAALAGARPNPVAVAVQRARNQFPQLKVEVEADTLEDVDQAVAAGADFILLDNMSLEQLRQAVQKCRGKVRTEASGGVTLSTVRSIAECGVDFISVGALTHSARSVDIALDFTS
jgi:nicotinate-nucleotide pyrophosphorylase (carboxylating)